MLGIESKHEPIKGEYAKRLREEIETIENNRRMKTVYTIAETRILKHLTGARAGKIIHTAEIKKVWNEEKRTYVVGFDTIEEAVSYMNKRKENYLTSGNGWELVTDIHPGYFVVKSEWGVKSKGETVDSWNVVPLVIE